MADFDSPRTPKIGGAFISAQLAISLAEKALRERRISSAVDYVELVYAILDEEVARQEARSNASDHNTG